MSVESAIQRISSIEQAAASGSGQSAAGASDASAAAAGAGTASFASALSQASLAALAQPAAEGLAGTEQGEGTLWPGATGGSASLASPGGASGLAGGSSGYAAALAGYGQSGAGGVLGGAPTGVEAYPALGRSAYASSIPYGATYPAGNATYLGPSGGLPGVAGLTPIGANLPIGQRMVAIAESQAGQHEEPMGSNEGAAIALYRSATRESAPGAPWCAYFASWVARQAGVPIGAEGQGLGAVSEIWQWAQQSGRAIANGPGVIPQPGDLMLFGNEHVAIVRSVLPDGRIATVEGNYENKVALNVRSASEATGYVQLG